MWYWATNGMPHARLVTFTANITSAPTGNTPRERVTAATGPWSRDAELAQFRRSSG